MSNKKLSEIGLSKLWEKVFSLIKLLIGDVKVAEKGTLQDQIDTVNVDREKAELELKNDILDLQGRFETLAKEHSIYQNLEDSAGVYIEDSDGNVIEGKIVYRIA